MAWKANCRVSAPCDQGTDEQVEEHDQVGSAVRDQAIELLFGALARDERGEPCGTIACQDDPTSHYANVWTRDNVGPMLFFLRYDPSIVGLFLDALIRRQSRLRRTYGLMPIGFSPRYDAVDYGGEEAIGAVHSVDSTLWFVILVGLFVETTQDLDWLRARREALEAALGLLVAPRFDPLPLMAAPESVTEIDRPAGLYGYPLQLQVLLALALRWAARLLDYLEAGSEIGAWCRLEAEALQSWINRWYWIDRQTVDDRELLAPEGHGKDNPNPFNIDYSRLRPAIATLPPGCGYLGGTLRTRHLDTRLWPFPNLLAAVSGILSEPRIEALMGGIAARWEDLIGCMPVTVCWPSLTGPNYEIWMDGDARARPGSYHNGGHWPYILWSFVAACLASGRGELATRALAVASSGLPPFWAEFYDSEGHPGLNARTRQTWSIAGYLVADEALRSGIEAFWQVRLVPQGGWLVAAAPGPLQQER